LAKIYLSSTYSDLIEHRKAVYDELRRLRHDVIAMEDYVATDQRPLDKCLADVTSCDLYIGLFAWRYGYIPVVDNPAGRSITELEYRKACSTGKSCLIFLLKEDAAWPPRLADMMTKENSQGERIIALRQELVTNNTFSFFGTVEELASLVSVAVTLWEKQQNSAMTSDSTIFLRTRYLERVSRRYNSVKLPIGPTSFSLHAVFQPLTLRKVPCLSPPKNRSFKVLSKSSRNISKKLYN
jgi:hypothetical protein